MTSAEAMRATLSPACDVLMRDTAVGWPSSARVRPTARILIAYIQPVGIAGRGREVAKAREVGMPDHFVHQQLPYAVPAMRRRHEDVAEPGECRAIGDDPREPRQLVPGVGGEGQRVLDGEVEDVARLASAQYASSERSDTRCRDTRHEVADDAGGSDGSRRYDLRS
jgi:hypothetical protein